MTKQEKTDYNAKLDAARELVDALSLAMGFLSRAKLQGDSTPYDKAHAALVQARAAGI